MKRFSYAILTFAGIILTAYIILQAFLGPPVITVINKASSAVSNVVLYDDDYRTIIPKIAPGESVTVVVHPRGESGIQIQFSSPTGLKSLDDLAYIEESGGYCYNLIILDNYTVKADFINIGCFSWRRIV